MVKGSEMANADYILDRPYFEKMAQEKYDWNIWPTFLA